MSVIRTSETMRSGDYVYTGTRYDEATSQISGSGYLRHTFSLNNQPAGSTFTIGVNTDEIYVNEVFTVGTARTYDEKNVLIKYRGGNNVAISYLSYDSSGYMSCFLAYIEYAGLSCKAYSQVKTSYAAIPNTIEFVLTPFSTVCPVTSLEGCFENCRLTSAPTIPSGITNMTRCFYGCSRLTGNISVNNTPAAYTNAFGNTSKDIFILNNGGNIWQTIVGNYSNVHYEADDSIAPVITDFKAIRVDASGDTTPEPTGLYAYVTAKLTTYETNIPVGWTNEVKTKILTDNGSTESPTWHSQSGTDPLEVWCWISLGDTATHELSLQITDSIKEGSTEKKSQQSQVVYASILKSYALVDYYHDENASGVTEGMAIGKYAEYANLLDIDMPVRFRQGLNSDGDVQGENLVLALDTSATSGTDKDVYDALVSLGWDSDVIV